MDCFCNFILIEIESFGCGDQLIFHIVMAMNDSDNTGRVSFNWNIYTKQIHIEFFTITTQYIWYIPVINRIDKAGVFGVYASNRSTLN